jgi:hypothetical protein
VNHFIGLLILSTCVATAFALLNRDTPQARLRYFFRLIGYMVVGSLLFSWVMYSIPW